jgi:hypothetical protein
MSNLFPFVGQIIKKHISLSLDESGSRLSSLPCPLPYSPDNENTYHT